MKIKELNENIIEFTLTNGLNVKVYDNPNLTKFYANYTTFFGSNDLEYYNDENELVRLPDGIAHFFEHVMFASEEGDVFNEFALNSASANAYTSYNQTSYLFSTATNLLENLKLLVTMVQTSYFTKEVVEKERGIITEEINMYHQMPEWRLRNHMYETICNTTNYKIDIAGTEATINQITPEMLDDIFAKFYIPENQILVLSGNFANYNLQAELEKMQIIKKSQVKRIKKNQEYIKQNHEHQVTFTMENNQMHYANIVYKFDPISDPIANLKAYFSVASFLNAYISALNPEYNQAIEQGLINRNLGHFMNFTADIGYFGVQIVGEEFINSSKEFINSTIKFEKIDKKMIKLGLRKLIATEIRIADDKIDFVESIISCQLDGITMSEYYDILFSLTEDEIINNLKILLNNQEKFTIFLK